MAKRKKKLKSKSNQILKARRNGIRIFKDIEEVVPFPISYEAVQVSFPRHQDAIIWSQEIANALDSKESPLSVLEEVETALENHPTDCVLLHLEVECLRATGRLDEAAKRSRALFDQYPDYLYSRIDLAETAVDSDELERIPEILGVELSLPALFPERKMFHADEVFRFYQLVLYHLGLGTTPVRIAAHLFLLRRVDEPKFRRSEAYSLYTDFMDDLCGGVSAALDEQEQGTASSGVTAPSVNWRYDSVLRDSVEQAALEILRAEQAEKALAC